MYGLTLARARVCGRLGNNDCVRFENQLTGGWQYHLAHGHARRRYDDRDNGIGRKDGRVFERRHVSRVPVHRIH